MTPNLRRLLFETLYRNKYLYRFASTVPFAGQWRVWQRQVLPRLRGHDVLEIGCGPGDLLADMLAAGYSCSALDRSPQMVAAARGTLKKRQLGSPGQVIQGSVQSLPFSNSTFDTIVSTFPSEYIYDTDTIAEVARVLRPGGRLIVIESANLLPVGFFQPLLMLVQALVYGSGTLRKARPNSQPATEEQRPRTSASILIANDGQTGGGTTTHIVKNASFGQHIPLEQHNLSRRSERVVSRRWEVYIIIGEKSAPAEQG